MGSDFSPLNAKKCRVYFNSHEDAPLIWSVDNGDHSTEVIVRHVEVRVPTSTRYEASAALPEPKAWIECYGVLEIVDDIATITSPVRPDLI